MASGGGHWNRGRHFLSIVFWQDGKAVSLMGPDTAERVRSRLLDAERNRGATDGNGVDLDSVRDLNVLSIQPSYNGFNIS